jgi:hypothetical protein
MRTYCSTVGLISALMLSVAGAALADDSAPGGAAAMKPAVPSVSEILDRSGIILTGYLDGNFAYQHNDTTSRDYSTFALQQAAFTLAMQPASVLAPWLTWLPDRIRTVRPAMAASLQDKAPRRLVSIYCRHSRSTSLEP